MFIFAADYILPLAVGKKIGSNSIDNLHRYAGIAFYIGSRGLIATCAHIVESLKENEILVAKDFKRNAFYEVKDVIYHKKMDFAVGHIDVVNNRFMKPINEKITPLCMGMDVQAFGYYGKKGKNLSLQYRFFKGYISFLGNKPASSDRCRTLCELSFPSLAGFSGAPVMLNNSDGLVGMLYIIKDEFLVFPRRFFLERRLHNSIFM